MAESHPGNCKHAFRKFFVLLRPIMSYQPPQPDAHPSTDRPPALLDQVPQGGPVAPLRQDLRDVNVSTSHNPLPLPQPQPHQQPPATLSPLQQRPPPRNFGDKQSRWGPPGGKKRKENVHGGNKGSGMCTDRRRPHGGGGGPPPKRREEFRYPQSGEVYLRFLINSRVRFIDVVVVVVVLYLTL